jgi:predicted AAA+ superfamily ATPase
MHLSHNQSIKKETQRLEKYREGRITDKIVARTIKHSWIASNSVMEIRRKRRKKTMLGIFEEVHNVLVFV